MNSSTSKYAEVEKNSKETGKENAFLRHKITSDLSTFEKILKTFQEKL